MRQAPVHVTSSHTSSSPSVPLRRRSRRVTKAIDVRFAIGQAALVNLEDLGERERWIHRSIDSRNCALPNKLQTTEWIEDYGRVLRFRACPCPGPPPNADELEYIDRARIVGERREPSYFSSKIQSGWLKGAWREAKGIGSN